MNWMFLFTRQSIMTKNEFESTLKHERTRAEESNLFVNKSNDLKNSMLDKLQSIRDQFDRQRERASANNSHAHTHVISMNTMKFMISMGCERLKKTYDSSERCTFI